MKSLTVEFSFILMKYYSVWHNTCAQYIAVMGIFFLTLCWNIYILAACDLRISQIDWWIYIFNQKTKELIVSINKMFKYKCWYHYLEMEKAQWRQVGNIKFFSVSFKPVDSMSNSSFAYLSVLIIYHGLNSSPGHGRDRKHINYQQYILV